MKKLKKRIKITQRSYPKALSCNHIPPVFLTTNGKYRVMLLPYREVHYDKFSAKAWCSRCGWVNINNEQYEDYVRFDGAQKT